MTIVISRWEGVVAETYPPPPFGATITQPFVYAGWSVDPVRVGPFVRASRVRRSALDRLTVVARSLLEHADVLQVRLFQTSAIIPVRGVPLHDVIMLVRVEDLTAATAVLEHPALTASTPATMFSATNRARFGLTEDGSPAPNILLNHFTGSDDQDDAVTAWRALSAWFQAKTGIDNSTLLVPESSAPYVMVNYARIPGAVPPFMVRQVLRPSFHRYVRRMLARHQLTSLPIFVRPVDISGDRDGQGTE